MKTAGDVTILMVDDEPEIRSSLKRFLRREPYRTRFAGGGQEALDILASQPIDIIVSDLRMPGMDGLSLLKRVKADYPGVIRLILSASRDMENIIEAINTGQVYRFISKPLDPGIFKGILMDTVEYHLLIAGRRETIAEIERRLLQSRPPRNLCGVDLAALMIPSGDLNGDFADYFVYNPYQVDILVGDVMGKGVRSAMVAAGIKHQFAKALAVYDCSTTPRIACPHHSFDASQFGSIVSVVHTECIEDLLELEMFCTLDFARLDLTQGKLHLFDLGHCPVIHFQADTGGCTFLKSDNTALGMVVEPAYQVVSVDIMTGDVILFHTDGVTETQSPDREMFSTDRLADIVRANHHLPAQQLVDRIGADVAAFSGRGRYDDDFTCIALRIETCAITDGRVHETSPQQ